MTTDYTNMVREFIENDRLIELCDAANDIYDAMRIVCPSYCTPTLIWACMIYAGERSIPHLAENVPEFDPLA